MIIVLAFVAFLASFAQSQQCKSEFQGYLNCISTNNAFTLDDLKGAAKVCFFNNGCPKPDLDTKVVLTEEKPKLHPVAQIVKDIYEEFSEKDKNCLKADTLRLRDEGLAQCAGSDYAKIIKEANPVLDDDGRAWSSLAENVRHSLNNCQSKDSQTNTLNCLRKINNREQKCGIPRDCAQKPAADCSDFARFQSAICGCAKAFKERDASFVDKIEELQNSFANCHMNWTKTYDLFKSRLRTHCQTFPDAGRCFTNIYLEAGTITKDMRVLFLDIDARNRLEFYLGNVCACSSGQ